MTTIVSTGVRIGTRGSALALVQAGLVADALMAIGADPRLETIVTDGDRRQPDTAWGEGAFVGAIEAALLEGRIDVAVHSAKDVPTDEDPRLTIAAYLVREPAEDAIVVGGPPPRHPADGGAQGLDLVPLGARVGTDSPRRTAFLRAARPDLRVHPLHGNVDTRLRRLDDGETDALVLAVAGLRRLGRADRISVVVPTSILPPAPGQGALAIQVRTDDLPTRTTVARLDDPAARRAVEAERALLAAAGGGCRSPLGAIGSVGDDGLTLQAGYARSDGLVTAHTRRHGGSGSDAELVANVLDDLAERAAVGARASGDPRVAVTRASSDAAAIQLALVDRALAPVAIPTIEIALPADPTALAAIDDAVRRIEDLDWVVVTSQHAVAVLAASAARLGIDLAAVGTRWAAVGGTTRRTLRSIGVRDVFVPERSTGAALAASLPDPAGAEILLPRSDLADDVVPMLLAERGARVRTVVAYRTLEAPASSRPGLAAALVDGVEAAVVTSASAVRGWLDLARAIGAEDAIRGVPLVAIGPTTATQADDLGLRVLARSAAPGPGAVADATLAALATIGVTR